MIDLVSCVLTRAQSKRVLSKESEQSDYPLDAVLISTQVPVLRYMFCFDEVETCLRYALPKRKSNYLPLFANSLESTYSLQTI